MPIAEEAFDPERLLATGRLFSAPYEDGARFADHAKRAPYCGAFAARVRTHEGAIASSERNSAQRAFGGVDVSVNCAVWPDPLWTIP